MPHTPSPCTLHLHLNTYVRVLNAERVHAGAECVRAGVECVHTGVKGGGIEGTRVGVEHVRVGVEQVRAVAEPYARVLNAYADAPQARQHARICTQRGLRDRSPTQRSDGPPGRRSDNTRAPTSPPTHPLIPMAARLLRPLRSP